MKKDWIARQIRAEVIVGSFVLLALLALGYFTIILSRDSWFRAKQRIEVQFTDVVGLRAGDSVVVRGMTVGKVDKLELTNDSVHVVLALDQRPVLHEGYQIKIVPTSLLGGLYLEIDSGPTNAPVVPTRGILQGESPRDLIGDAAEVMAALKRGLIEGDMIENLQVTLEKVRLVAERLEAGEGTIGKLLSKDDTLYRDVAATAASLREITGRIEQGQGTLGKLMSPDDMLYTNLTAIVASLKDITGRVAAGEGTIGKLLSKDDQVYQDLAATTKSLRAITEKVEKGEGVLGKLMMDEKLGVQVEETITEVRATMDDLRETSPVVTFTSIFFGVL